jgi:hypothetical protein
MSSRAPLDPSSVTCNVCHAGCATSFLTLAHNDETVFPLQKVDAIADDNLAELYWFYLVRCWPQPCENAGLVQQCNPNASSLGKTSNASAVS